MHPLSQYKVPLIIIIIILIALLRYNLYTKNCTYSMNTIYLVWVYVYTCGTITTVKVISKIFLP